MASHNAHEKGPILLSSIKLESSGICKKHGKPMDVFCHHCSSMICLECVDSHSEGMFESISQMKTRIEMQKFRGEVVSLQQTITTEIAAMRDLFQSLRMAHIKLENEKNDILKQHTERVAKASNNCRLELIDITAGLWRLGREYESLLPEIAKKGNDAELIMSKICEKESKEETVCNGIIKLQSMKLEEFALQIRKKVEKLVQEQNELSHRDVLKSEFKGLETGNEKPLREEIALLRSKCQNLAKTLDDARKDCGNLQAALDVEKGKCENLKADLDGQKKRCGDLEMALDNGKGARANLEAALNCEKKRCGDLQKASKVEKENYKTLEVVRRDETRKCTELKVALDNEKRINGGLKASIVAEKESSKNLDKALKDERESRKTYAANMLEKLTRIKRQYTQILEAENNRFREIVSKSKQECSADVKSKIDKMKKKINAEKSLTSRKFSASETAYRSQIEKLLTSANEAASTLTEMYKLFLPDFKGEKTMKALANVLIMGPETYRLNIDNESWTPLLKAADTDLLFSNPLWTNEMVQMDTDSKDIHQLTGKSAKYSMFCLMPVGELLIVCKDGGERKVRLRLPEKKPLLKFFTDPNPTPLVYVSGAKDPAELACGHKGLEFYDPVWRINSFSKEGYKFKCRLGGYFHQASGQNGADSKGYACSAEMAGFGLEDNQWAPFTKGKKSFGIRCLSDKDGFGNGQCQAQAMIYGR